MLLWDEPADIWKMNETKLSEKQKLLFLFHLWETEIMSTKDAKSSSNFCFIFYMSLQGASGCLKWISETRGMPWDNLNINITRWRGGPSAADAEISTYCHSRIGNVTLKIWSRKVIYEGRQ